MLDSPPPEREIMYGLSWAIPLTCPDERYLLPVLNDTYYYSGLNWVVGLSYYRYEIIHTSYLARKEFKLDIPTATRSSYCN